MDGQKEKLCEEGFQAFWPYRIFVCTPYTYWQVYCMGRLHTLHSDTKEGDVRAGAKAEDYFRVAFLQPHRVTTK